MHWFGVLLLAIWTQASAVDLNPECYRYYELFNAEGLTYEEVGQLADKMHEKECWPALQELLETEQTAELPPITDCNSLVPHIVQMTVDQATVDSPAMIKLSSVETLDMQSSCVESLMSMSIDQSAKRRRDIERGCAEREKGKILQCVGTARFPYGKKRMRFYLERDEDGDEFIGYVSLE